jgi:hypothetical protein
MSWDYHWLPILCNGILSGRESRASVALSLAAVSASIAQLEQARLGREQSWLGGRRARRDVLAYRKLQEVGSTEIAALRESVECLSRFCEGGGIEFIYRARSRAQLGELSSRRYTSDWLKLNYPSEALIA